MHWLRDNPDKQELVPVTTMTLSLQRPSVFGRALNGNRSRRSFRELRVDSRSILAPSEVSAVMHSRRRVGKSPHSSLI